MEWKTAEQLKVQYLNNNYCDFVPFSFVGLIHCVPYPLSSSIENSNKSLVYHTSEQLKVLLNSPAEQWITGPAGTGKTWVLIEKVKELDASQSGERILVVCFIEPLSKSLEEQFKDCSCVVVKIFETLLFEITEKRNYSDCGTRENINLAVEILERKAPEYDHIFVDECEDLIGDKWPVLFQKMWKGNADDCGSREVTGCKYKWFFYDTNQNMRWPDELFQEAVGSSYKLTRVLRNTGNIFDQSKKYLLPSSDSTKEITLGHKEWGLNINWQASLPSRNVAEKMGAKSVANCINDLIKKNVAEADICVLVENEDVRDRLSLELKELEVDNHNAEEHFEVNHKNKVLVDSIMRFKGLESKVVILYYPEFTTEFKKRLYIAFSRCSCYLVVITTKECLDALKSKYGVSSEVLRDCILL